MTRRKILDKFASEVERINNAKASWPDARVRVEYETALDEAEKALNTHDE